MRRNLIIGLVLAVVVGLVTIGVVTTQESTQAYAGARKVGTGLFSTSHLTGKISFSPPLTTAGGKPDKATIKLTGTDLVGGNPVVYKALIGVVQGQHNNAVATLLEPQPISFTATYEKPDNLVPSQFSGTLTGSVSSSGVVTFSVEGITTGSFPSSSTLGTGVVTQSESEIASKAATTGVSELAISSGTIDAG
jgi:hypothetical protein